MAEDQRESSKARFKSKWNRVFKEKEEHEQTPQHTNSFKLNEDVNDFLKPSTDRAASTRPAEGPKIDVAAAQRWPDAHEVRRASAATPSNDAAHDFPPNGFRKPRRRPGLMVGFAKAVPEVIGEGGDESEEPPSEISRRRAVMSRSVSSRVPSGIAEGQQRAGPVAQDPRQARMPDGSQDDFRPQPLRRAGTSFNEVSLAVQRKQAPPPVEDDLVERPRLSRTPTGFSSQDERLPQHVDEDQHPVPQIDTRFLPNQTESPGSAGSNLRRAESPQDPVVLAARSRDMKSGEGMALRRASAMIVDDDNHNEAQKRQSLSTGIRPPQQLYETLSRPDAESYMPQVTNPRSSISPAPSVSPPARSPFKDPKYNRQDRVPSSLRQASYQEQNSAGVAPERVVPPPEQSSRQMRLRYEPSYMRAAQPVQSSQPPIPQVQQPTMADEADAGSRRDVTPSYTRPAQAPGAQVMAAIQRPSEKRDRSPLRDRLLGENVPPTQSQSFYNMPSASSNSLNHFSPSPHSHHSRSGSRDGDSPQQQLSAGSSHQQSLPSPRFQVTGGNPSGGSPKSSATGKPSALSPYGPSASLDYFPASRSQPQTLRPSGGNLQIDDWTSRPGSSDSSHSLQRPTNYSSAPRAPQVRPPQPRVPSLRDDEIGRPSGSSSSDMQQMQLDSSTSQRAQPQTWMAKTAANNLRQEDAQRSSSDQHSTQQRPILTPQPTSDGSSAAADGAYADFAARVAHMKGVFRLTAEKERPADQCPPRAWLRAAIWWYLKGKAGLELYLQQQRPISPNGQPRELLMQPHVDLAKTWWILTDLLDAFDGIDDPSPQSASASGGSDSVLPQSIAAVKSHIKSLSLSMSRSYLMPPHQSLIQGQDTSIWLKYPRFTSDSVSVLSGVTSSSYMVEEGKPSLSPLEALPLGDMRDVFFYGRFPVEVSLNTDHADTDRVVMPCTLSMLRGKRDFLTSIAIASQSELVSIKVSPRSDGERGLSWHDVSWKASSFGMVIRLPLGFDLMVRMQERDFRSLWKLVEYARKVEHSLRPERDEKLVHDARLAELQYADSSNANAFPPDKMRRCTALVFERTITITDGGGLHKMHRGYRLLLLTDPDHKSLASASHEVCLKSPLFFEFLTDAAAHGMAAMVVRIREDTRQCRVLLVFPNVGARQNFYDVLNGMLVTPDETIVGKMSLNSVNIEPATQTEGFTQSPHPALRMLQWQKLGVTNTKSDDPYNQAPDTVESESLRVVARHSTGCMTDRLNLGKGELLIRLPCNSSPAIQILRNPQQDMGMSIDTRHSQASIIDGVMELYQLVRQQATIRTFTFASQEDLHAFQTSITGSSIRYDGLASNLSIARRMMVVPIYKKWEASNVRLQVVSHSRVVQIVAFMEGFSHADALCFQVKSTDTFETIKGDGKGKKWAVKLVDAKFSLPRTVESEKERHEKDKDKEKERVVTLTPEERETKVRQRFVNLEGLEYAEEHDDITVGFETSEERDRFAQTLPAPATVGRGITLKRRI